MSIQNESFPYDDDLEFSRNSGKNLVFPHHKPRRNNALENKEASEEHVVCVNKNISSSPLQNQDESTQSSNDFCLSSETSGKTNASEPNDLQGTLESDKKKSEFTCHNPNKATSYQDIHSEYTKRRYKHVESKVGQYIANMKAEDEKRRNSSKFQRHRSMPETLHGSDTAVTELNNDSKQHGLLRRSTNDLHRIHNQLDLHNYHDTDNYDNLTTTTSSVSTRDSSSENGIFVDKQTYDQLLNYKERKDYLENKLQEENAEKCRLKLNLDTMRIEYSMCKDKLKQLTQAQRFPTSFGSIHVAATLAGASLQSLIHTQNTKEKSTQTDIMLTPSPILPQNKPVNEMFATPFTPDSNNNSFDLAALGVLAPAHNKISKSIATIQPLSLNFSNLVEQDSNNNTLNTTMGYLRQRSNSLAMRKKSTTFPTNISKTSSVASNGLTSSRDSAIDIEVAETPKSQRRSRREEFVYYDQRSQRSAIVEIRNADENYKNTENNSSTIINTTAEGLTGSSNKRNRRKHNLRSRVMRLFRACRKCKEPPNMSLETAHNSQHSQIPLLEKSI